MRFNFVSRQTTSQFILCWAFLAGCATPQVVEKSALPFAWTPSARQISGLDLERNVRWNAVSVLDRASALEYMGNQTNAITGLLEPEADPYTGNRSVQEKCLPKNLPEPKRGKGEGGEWQRMSFYSSDGQVLGFCGGGAALLKTQHLMLYCEKQQTLFIVRFFFPVNHNWIVEPVAKCL